jgi:hypothetical protein
MAFYQPDKRSLIGHVKEHRHGHHGEGHDDQRWQTQLAKNTGHGRAAQH